MIPSYARYWHGYVVLLRPLLYLIEYKDLEILNSFLLLLLACIICSEIGKRKKIPYALSFATTFLLIMPMIVGVCLQYLPMALISYLGVLFLIRHREWLEQNNRLYLFFAFLGILTSFFDLLTFPLYSWGIPAVWWLLLDEKDTGNQEKEYTLQTIFSAISWIFGYLGMWIGKWFLSCIILHKNMFAEALDAILERSGMSEFTLHDRYYSIYKNWRHYSYIGYALLMLLWLIVWFYHGFRKGWKKSSKRYGLGLIFISSFVWYAACAQHTNIHHYFTYRIFSVMITAGMGLMLESMYNETAIPKTTWKGWKTFSIMAISSCFAALAVVYFSYEETEVSNKTIPCWLDDYYVDSVQMEMDFTPAQKRILGICVAMSTDSEEGFYSLKLFDQGNVVYAEEIPVSFMGDLNYALYPVDWHLKKGKTYQLTVESVGIKGPIRLYISDYDMSDYTEIGPVTLNGETLNAKSCVGEIYWARPFSRNRKLFLLGTWFTTFLLAWYVFGVKFYSSLKSAAS